MIHQILSSQFIYNVYLDIKDTTSSDKLKNLKRIIENKTKNKPIKNIQVVRSEEIEIMQLTDVLIGAMSYYARDLQSSQTKRKLVSLIQKRSGNNLKNTSMLRDDKFNVFYWEAK